MDCKTETINTQDSRGQRDGYGLGIRFVRHASPEDVEGLRRFVFLASLPPLPDEAEVIQA